MVQLFSQYVCKRELLLAGVHSVLIVLALLGGVWLRFWGDSDGLSAFLGSAGFAVQAMLFVVVFQSCLLYSLLCSPAPTWGPSEGAVWIGQCVGAGCVVLGLAHYLLSGVVPGSGVMLTSVLLLLGLALTSWLALNLLWRWAVPRENVLVVGTGNLAVRVARELVRRNDLNLRLVGFCDPAPDREGARALLGYPVLGEGEDLERVVREHHVSRVILATEALGGPTGETLLRLRLDGLRLEDAHSAVVSLTGRVCLDTVHPSWFLHTRGFRASPAALAAKRVSDLMLGFAGLVLSLPLLLAVAVAVRLDSPGPILFRQVRVGRHGRPFEVLKFRSMRLDAERDGARWAQPADPRVTRIGGFLRQYRLDELPQFVNILRGDMSFVGPRPERPVFVEELRKRVPYYGERHAVRPGLTGWAQVQYPYGASIEDAARKLEYDLFYLKSLSLLFDAMILLKTVRTVLTGWGGR